MITPLHCLPVLPHRYTEQDINLIYRFSSPDKTLYCNGSAVAVSASVSGVPTTQSKRKVLPRTGVNLDINHLYTHTHWLNVRDGKSGTVDYLNTAKNSYKMCPLYILPHWAAFKAKVQSYMSAGTSVPATPSAKQFYRVRKSWSDAKSQIGAFSSLENAKKACKAGYSVFDNSGKVVYSVVKSYAKGAKVTLNNTTLYSSSTAKTGTKKSGTYDLYDGQAVNNRMRITNSASNCGKTPVGSYVTGRVNKTDI